MGRPVRPRLDPGAPDSALPTIDQSLETAARRRGELPVSDFSPFNQLCSELITSCERLEPDNSPRGAAFIDALHRVNDLEPLVRSAIEGTSAPSERNPNPSTPPEPTPRRREPHPAAGVPTKTPDGPLGRRMPSSQPSLSQRSKPAVSPRVAEALIELQRRRAADAAARGSRMSENRPIGTAAIATSDGLERIEVRLKPTHSKNRPGTLTRILTPALPASPAPTASEDTGGVVRKPV